MKVFGWLLVFIVVFVGVIIFVQYGKIPTLEERVKQNMTRFVGEVRSQQAIIKSIVDFAKTNAPDIANDVGSLEQAYAKATVVSPNNILNNAASMSAFEKSQTDLGVAILNFKINTERHPKLTQNSTFDSLLENLSKSEGTLSDAKSELFFSLKAYNEELSSTIGSMMAKIFFKQAKQKQLFTNIE